MKWRAENFVVAQENIRVEIWNVRFLRFSIFVERNERPRSFLRRSPRSAVSHRQQSTRQTGAELTLRIIGEERSHHERRGACGRIELLRIFVAEIFRDRRARTG